MTPKRPRIKIGVLVGSTNPVTYSIIKCITVEHRYNSLTYKRVRRVVQKPIESC